VEIDLCFNLPDEGRTHSAFIEKHRASVGRRGADLIRRSRDSARSFRVAHRLEIGIGGGE
jgi:hypothetical protein